MAEADEVPEAVSRAAEELYGLPPAGFTARRTALARELRKSGDRPAASTVAGLRRPTVAAWLVNQLARDEDAGADEPGRALLDRLLDLGEQTRQAQAALDGARIRELGRSRQPLVAALVRRAGVLGEQHGQPVAAGVQRELEETFGAAVADPAAAAAVASGMLTRALAYAGLGEVDLEAATALTVPPGSALAPRPPREPAAGRRRHLSPVPDAGPSTRAAGAADPDPGPAPQERAERERAERAERERAAEQAERAQALARARADADAAEQALTASLEKQQQAQDRERELTRAVDRLQEELARARRDLVTASHAVGAAERDVVHRERAAREARKALTRAEQSAELAAEQSAAGQTAAEAPDT